MDRPSNAYWDAGIVFGAAAVLSYGLYRLFRPSPAQAAIGGCPEQSPQDFLIRSNYLKDPALFKKAVDYRTAHYGYFPGFGDPSLNDHPPSFYAAKTSFFGVPVTLNQKVISALKCVEQAILQDCASTPYQPQALSGLRMANSYHDFEVSNHVYGIALDVDPIRNPCCGCTPGPAGPQNPICQELDTGPYSRMAMPECWVHAFERYGWYWLGHDVLRDKMHFEFLGDPDLLPSVSVPKPTASMALQNLSSGQDYGPYPYE
ncbi:MAG: M15 family metallopeptidase [Polyangiales bacterium]